MTQHDECVVATFRSFAAAEQAVHLLDQEQVPREKISLVTPGTRLDAAVTDDLRLDDDSLPDAAKGAGLGGMLGLLAGFGAMSLSGLGVVFLFGPLFGGLFDTTVGAFLGAFAGWGVHEEEVRRIQELVRQGNSVVVVHSEPLEVAHAERILRDASPATLQHFARTGSEWPGVYGGKVTETT